MFIAADAAGTRHHSVYHRLFAAARWSLDELGLAIFASMLPRIGRDRLILLAIVDTLAGQRGQRVLLDYPTNSRRAETMADDLPELRGLSLVLHDNALSAGLSCRSNAYETWARPVLT